MDPILSPAGPISNAASVYKIQPGLHRAKEMITGRMFSNVATRKRKLRVSAVVSAVVYRGS